MVAVVVSSFPAVDMCVYDVMWSTKEGLLSHTVPTDQCEMRDSYQRGSMWKCNRAVGGEKGNTPPRNKKIIVGHFQQHQYFNFRFLSTFSSLVIVHQCTITISR